MEWPTLLSRFHALEVCVDPIGESADVSLERGAPVVRTLLTPEKIPNGDGGAAACEGVRRERGSMQHWLLEKAIVDLCLVSGVTPLTNQHIDLLVNSESISIVFEIKSCAPLDVVGPLRRAIWQLLEYRYLYRDALGSDVRLCVVIERRPRSSHEWFIGFLEYLRIGIIWRNDGDDRLSCSDFTKALLGDVLPSIKTG